MDHMSLNKNLFEDPLGLLDYEKHRVLKYTEMPRFIIEDPGYRIDDELDTQPDKNFDKDVVKSCPFEEGCIVRSLTESIKKPENICNNKSSINSYKHKTNKQNLLKSTKSKTINLNMIKIIDDNFLHHLKGRKKVNTTGFDANTKNTTKYIAIKAMKNKHVVYPSNDKDINVEIKEEIINNSTGQSTIGSKAAAISKKRRNTIPSSFLRTTTAFNICDKNIHNHYKIIPHYHKLTRNPMQISHSTESQKDHVVLSPVKVVIRNITTETLIPEATDMEISKDGNINTTHVNTESFEKPAQRNFFSIPVLINKNTMPTESNKYFSTLKTGQHNTFTSHDSGVQQTELCCENISDAGEFKNDDNINDGYNYIEAANKFVVSDGKIPVLINGNVHHVRDYKSTVQNNLSDRSTQVLFTNNCDLQSASLLKQQLQHIPSDNCYNTLKDNTYSPINNSMDSSNINKLLTATHRHNIKTLVTPPIRCSTPVSSRVLLFNPSDVPLNVLNTHTVTQPLLTTKTDNRKSMTVQNQNSVTNVARTNNKNSNATTDQLNNLSQIKSKTQSNAYTKHPILVRALESPLIRRQLYNDKEPRTSKSLANNNAGVDTVAPKKEYSKPILPIRSYKDMLKIIEEDKFLDLYKPHLL